MRFWLAPPAYAGDVDKYVIAVLRRISAALAKAGIHDCRVDLEVGATAGQSLCTLQCNPAEISKVAWVIGSIEWFGTVAAGCHHKLQAKVRSMIEDQGAQSNEQT